MYIVDQYSLHCVSSSLNYNVYNTNGGETCVQDSLGLHGSKLMTDSPSLASSPSLSLSFFASTVTSDGCLGDDLPSSFKLVSNFSSLLSCLFRDGSTNDRALPPKDKDINDNILASKSFVMAEFLVM